MGFPKLSRWEQEVGLHHMPWIVTVPFFSFPEKVNSCDHERQSALEEARQNPREGIVIPECAPGGLYKPVQCHQSTGYCWCVLVDTGRPLPGTSTRYESPPFELHVRK